MGKTLDHSRGIATEYGSLKKHQKKIVPNLLALEQRINPAGSDNFVFTGEFPFPNGVSGRLIDTTADINRDGIIDFVALDDSNRPVVLINDGFGKIEKTYRLREGDSDFNIGNFGRQFLVSDEFGEPLAYYVRQSTGANSSDQVIVSSFELDDESGYYQLVKKSIFNVDANEVTSNLFVADFNNDNIADIGIFTNSFQPISNATLNIYLSANNDYSLETIDLPGNGVVSSSQKIIVDDILGDSHKEIIFQKLDATRPRQFAESVQVVTYLGDNQFSALEPYEVSVDGLDGLPSIADISVIKDRHYDDKKVITILVGTDAGNFLTREYLQTIHGYDADRTDQPWLADTATFAPGFRLDGVGRIDSVDLDGDGNEELVAGVSDLDGSLVLRYYGQGDGGIIKNFIGEQTFASKPAVYFFADYDGNFMTDIIGFNFQSSTLITLSNNNINLFNKDILNTNLLVSIFDDSNVVNLSQDFYAPGLSANKINDQMVQFNIQNKTDYSNIYKVIKSIPGTIYVGQEYLNEGTFIPNDPIWNNLINDPNFYDFNNNRFGMSESEMAVEENRLDLVDAWNIFRGNGLVPIGVVDDGIIPNHPDLKFWDNPKDPVDGKDNDGNGYVDDFNGFRPGDFNTNKPTGPETIPIGGTYGVNNRLNNGHGTPVAGIAAGIGNNSLGINGVNPNGEVFSASYLTQTSRTEVAVLQDLINLGLRVISGSYGTDQRDATGQPLKNIAIDLQLQSLIKSNPNVAFVQAAGNDGVDLDVFGASGKRFKEDNWVLVGALNVGALSQNLANYGFPRGSSFGQNFVQIAAPGQAEPSTSGSGGYQLFNGTSSATPAVSGALSLLLEANPGMTVKQAIQRMYDTADVFQPLVGKIAGGRSLNVGNMLHRFSIDVGGPTDPNNTNLTYLQVGLRNEAGLEGTTYRVFGESKDFDLSTTETYSWSIVSAPMGVNPSLPSITNIGSFDADITFPDNGTYTVRLTVTNGVTSRTKDIQVGVFNANPQIATASLPSTVVANFETTFQFNISDPSPLDVAIGLTTVVNFGDGRPDFRQTITTNPLLTLKRTYDAPGTYNFIITTKDKDGGLATFSQTITVDKSGIIPDPCGTGTVLAIGGTPGNDVMHIDSLDGETYKASFVASDKSVTTETNTIPNRKVLINTGQGNDFVALGLSRFAKAGDVTVRVDTGAGRDEVRIFSRFQGASVRQFAFGDYKLSYYGSSQVYVGLDNPEKVIVDPNRDDSFVAALYHKILLRNPTVAEVKSWSNRLNRETYDYLAKNILYSREASLIVVRKWYADYLGRRASDAEAAGWVSRLVNGRNRESTLAEFVASPEYVRKNGGNPNRVIDAFYQTFLGRNATGTDVANWIRDHGNPPNYKDVADQIFASKEFKTRQIGAFYRDILDRNHSFNIGCGKANRFDRTGFTVKEVQDWIFSGKSLQDIRFDMYRSREFQNNGL